MSSYQINNFYDRLVKGPIPIIAHSLTQAQSSHNKDGEAIHPNQEGIILGRIVSLLI